MEFHALTQLEGPLAGIIVAAPLGSKLRSSFSICSHGYQSVESGITGLCCYGRGTCITVLYSQVSQCTDSDFFLVACILVCGRFLHCNRFCCSRLTSPITFLSTAAGKHSGYHCCRQKQRPCFLHHNVPLLSFLHIFLVSADTGPHVSGFIPMFFHF